MYKTTKCLPNLEQFNKKEKNSDELPIMIEFRMKSFELLVMNFAL